MPSAVAGRTSSERTIEHVEERIEKEDARRTIKICIYHSCRLVWRFPVRRWCQWSSDSERSRICSARSEVAVGKRKADYNIAMHIGIQLGHKSCDVFTHHPVYVEGFTFTCARLLVGTAKLEWCCDLVSGIDRSVLGVIVWSVLIRACNNINGCIIATPRSTTLKKCLVRRVVTYVRWTVLT